MTAYDGNAITYDAIGNPLTYDGYTYTWQKGRELATINGNGTNLTFKYNSSGLRTQKISGSTTTEYVYADDQLMSQSNGTDTLSFIYDTDGQAIGVNRNGSNYYYLRNVQGDVIALYNCYGDINSRYTYDSWGNLIAVTDANGNAITDPTHIANVNPIRYRGYYYDVETGLYYLQSRYYNPQWGRFINADDMQTLTLSQDEILVTNLFAYCGNNPVNDSDPSGMFSIKTTRSGFWTITTIKMTGSQLADFLVVAGGIITIVSALAGVLSGGIAIPIAVAVAGITLAVMNVASHFIDKYRPKKVYTIRLKYHVNVSYFRVPRHKYAKIKFKNLKISIKRA